MHLQLRIFRRQYSPERISAAIGYISTIQCPLYCKHGAKHNAHPPDYAIWTVVPDIYNANTVPHILASTFNERICADIGDISTIKCALYCKHGAKYSAHSPVYAIRNVVPAIYNVITTPYIQASIFNWSYLRWYWWYSDNSMRGILQTWCQVQRTSSSFRHQDCGPRHIQCIYSSTYSGFNIQLNVSALLLEISWQCNARYTANLEPNAAHILQFTLCELWPRIYTKHLQLRIFRLQYSTERICVAIGDISTIQCALYCKLGAKYSTHCSVYDMWTVVPDICNEITDPHIQVSIFNWTYLRCFWRYHDNSMHVILQTWCQIHRPSSSFRYVNSDPGHIQCIYSSAYSVLNIQLNVSALQLEISRQFNVRYTAYLVPYIAHTLQFTLCELWSRAYTT
jgi:hypothetical protein